MKFILILICLCSTAFGCYSTKTGYAWNEVTSNAAYPQGYGFPVFVANEKIFAFHHEGVWSSADGVNWTKTDLPSVRRDAYESRNTFNLKRRFTRSDKIREITLKAFDSARPFGARPISKNGKRWLKNPSFPTAFFTARLFSAEKSG